MTEELRERYALAAAEWALMYPISSLALREGEAAEKLAKVWGEQIARYLTEYVRDKELERLRTALNQLWDTDTDDRHAVHCEWYASSGAYCSCVGLTEITRLRDELAALKAKTARIATEIEAERDKVREAEGATVRDESVITGIVNGLGIALKIVRGEA